MATAAAACDAGGPDGGRPLAAHGRAAAAVRDGSRMGRSTSARSTPTEAELLENLPWMRSQARSLTSDASLADDLVQDTLVAALSRPPVGGGPLRPWLALVMRRQNWRRFRASARRRRREQQAAIPDDGAEGAPASTPHFRRAVEVIARMREPYRRALRMRYLEGLPPRAIAARMGLSVRTVNSRLRRGLHELRQSMARERRFVWAPLAWLGALASSARRRARVGAWLGGTAVVALGTVLVLATSSGSHAVSAAAVEARGTAASATPSPLAGDPAPAERVEPGRRARRVAAEVGTGGRAGLEERAATHAPRAVREGIAVDGSGEPLAGVTVAFQPGATTRQHEGFAVFTADGGAARTTTTDARGRFALELPVAAQGRLCVADERWTAVGARGIAGEPTGPTTLVAAEPVRLRGRVVDGAGEPVAGALLRLELDQGLRSLPVEEGDLTLLIPTAESGSDGEFELEGHALDAARLLVSRAGFAGVRLALPADAREPFDVVLARRGAEPARVTGRVRDASGAPLAGAAVAGGAELVWTDAEGRFEVGVDARAGWRLTAYARGLLPVGRGSDGLPPSEVELCLREPARAIRGRVVDARGRGVAGAHVWAEDPTTAAVEGEVCVFAEELVGGRERRPPVHAVTDASGAFRLDSLLDRTYRLRAMRRDDLAVTPAVPVAAGPSGAGGAPGAVGVELRFATDAAEPTPWTSAPSIGGRVVALDGSPLEGVAVVLAKQLGLHGSGDGRRYRVGFEGRETRTGADGRFAFEGVAAGGAYLVLSGPGIIARTVDVPGDGSHADFEVVALRPAAVEVVVAPGHPAERLEFRDRDGSALPLSEFVDRSRPYADRSVATVPVRAGETARVAVPDSAAELLLWRADELVGRTPVVLAPNQWNRVDVGS